MSATSTALPTEPRVMLLDDDTFLLGVVSHMFDDIGGYRLSTETDARRALGKLATETPDLLICDLSMPDMDGFEFLIAAGNAGYHGHVMLLSGMNAGVRRTAERIARAHGLKLLGAYPKPLESEQLRAALDQMAAERQVQQQ